MEDPNELAASVQASTKQLTAVEFAAWSEFVRLYAGRGEHMQEAIRQADTYVEARRKRHPPTQP